MGKGFVYVILLPQRVSDRQGPGQRQRQDKDKAKHKDIDENIDINKK